MAEVDAAAALAGLVLSPASIATSPAALASFAFGMLNAWVLRVEIQR